MYEKSFSKIFHVLGDFYEEKVVRKEDYIGKLGVNFHNRKSLSFILRECYF